MMVKAFLWKGRLLREICMLGDTMYNYVKLYRDLLLLILLCHQHWWPHIGDERHCVFDCPHFHFQGLRQQHAGIFQDSHDAMSLSCGTSDQKSVCALVLAIVNEAQTA